MFLTSALRLQVLTADGKTQIGKISNKWFGLAKEIFTDADNFGIQFPVDLSVDVKATLLAANFLIVSNLSAGAFDRQDSRTLLSCKSISDSVFCLQDFMYF